MSAAVSPFESCASGGMKKRRHTDKNVGTVCLIAANANSIFRGGHDSTVR